MNERIKEIKKLESSPKVIKNLYNKEEIEEFLKLYKDLPTTVHNKKQNVIKKRWLQGYEGEACGECGNFTLVRNGTCMKCNTCGSTSGCS